jgi:hypothetical protein
VRSGHGDLASVWVACRVVRSGVGRVLLRAVCCCEAGSRDVRLGLFDLCGWVKSGMASRGVVSSKERFGPSNDEQELDSGGVSGLADLSVEELREKLAALVCPFCDRDGWKMLASHVVQAHGVTAADLREAAALPMRTGFTSEDLHDQRRTSERALRFTEEQRGRVSTANKGRSLQPSAARTISNRIKQTAMMEGEVNERRIEGIRRKYREDETFREANAERLRKLNELRH